MSARRLRPVDLVREHGLSAQAVGNYEEEGILPTAGRTRHGYRIYTPLHTRALRAFSWRSSRRTATGPQRTSYAR